MQLQKVSTAGITIKKDYHLRNPFSGGPERIRTAVRAFAELCLATRPQDLLLNAAL